MAIIFKSHGERRDWDSLTTKDRTEWARLAEEVTNDDISFYELVAQHRKERNLKSIIVINNH